jgi:hypothetical protein
MSRVAWNSRRINLAAVAAHVLLGAFVILVNIPFYLLSRKARS